MERCTPYVPYLLTMRTSGTDSMIKCNKKNAFSTSTCDRCGHWNCDDCIKVKVKGGKEVKKEKGNEEGEKSWVDVLFPVKGKIGSGGRKKGKDREV
jgi:hypothetical protein